MIGLLSIYHDNLYNSHHSVRYDLFGALGQKTLEQEHDSFELIVCIIYSALSKLLLSDVIDEILRRFSRKTVRGCGLFGS